MTVEATDDFEQWREHVSNAFVPLDAVSVGAARFEGSVGSASLRSLKLSEVAGRQVDVRRTRATIRCADPGLIKVGMQLTGHGVITQHNHRAVLAPGDFAVYDTREPYDLRFDGDFSMFVLMFPRDRLRIGAQRLTDITARRIDGNHGLGQLMSTFLAGLRRSLADGSLPTTAMFEDAIFDLLGATLEAEGAHTPPGSVLLVEAESVIDSTLADPSLSTAAIAAQLHISTRYLQKLFEAEGRTVSGWIRGRRLEQCRRDLSDPRLRPDSIATICARHGLPDQSSFSKLFRAAYGVSPSDYRADPPAV